MDQPDTDIELETDEGTGPMRGGNFIVYDDATGLPIGPGSVVKGHPTIGYGIALDVRGLTPGEALFILHDGENDFWNQIVDSLPWAANLDPVRQCALLSMAYNLGLSGLLTFHNTLTCMQNQDWPGTLAGLKASAWWNQVGQRAVRIGNMFLTGQWQLSNQGAQQ
jgi:lysozyme